MNHIRTSIFFALFIASALLQISCKKAPTTPPNIIWIVSEDNSKHYLDLFDENGAPTPNIQSLAEHGLIFRHAFSNAAVCSAARSTLISSSYGPRLATHYHRKQQMVPMPHGVQMFPAYLKAAGFYTSNNSKEDYNIVKGDQVWDESSNKASWKNRAEGQAFFHVQNYGNTHESRLHFTREDMEDYKPKTDINDVFVLPNHPQTDLFRYTNAYYRDKMMQVDSEIGALLEELKSDGLLENTFIFYYGDHGGVLPGSKGYLYEVGVHIPLIVHIPENYKHMVDMHAGSSVKGFVSFVDFGATVLNIAGVKVPEGMDGKPFLGNNVSMKEVDKRDETYSYADRFDEKYDMVRAVRKGKYKYMRNYQPFNYDGLMNAYRYKQLAYQEWIDKYKKGELNAIQSQFFERREPEMLFDLDSDPYETNNIAHDPASKEILTKLRQKLIDWQLSLPDLSFYPEHFLIKNAFENPVQFGQLNKENIKRYIDVANLSILNFADVRDDIEENLKSDDSWERYWALIACSSFENEAKEFSALAESISHNDTELINKVRAAEFLGIIKKANPVNVMTEALYSSTDKTEALLILNCIVLMQNIHHNYDFDLEISKCDAVIQKDKLVQIRIKYLD